MPKHTTLKRCTQCGEAKPATTEHFYREKRAKDGFTSSCKACLNARQNAYRQDNAKIIRVRKQEEYKRHRDAYIQRAAESQKKHRERYNELARGRWAANHEAINARIRERNAARGDEYRAVNRKWKAANRDRINEQARRDYAENRDDVLERQRLWRLANADKEKERTRQYREANRDKLKERGRQWYADNRDAVNGRLRERRRNDPDRFRRESVVKERARQARKAGLPDEFRGEDWQECLDYFNGCCAACGRPPGLFHTLAMDHWIPLTAPDCPGHVATNIIPLCHGLDGCNNSKGNRDALEWATEKFGKRKGRQIVSRILAYFGDIITEGG